MSTGLPHTRAPRRRSRRRTARPSSRPRRRARPGGRRRSRRRRRGGRKGLEDDVDLAVLDVSMPRMTGIQAASELSRRRPELRLLMLSMHDNEQYFFEALKAGASGYVLKSAADRDLVEACRATMRGEPFIYPAAVTALIRDHLERQATATQPRELLDSARTRGAQAHRRGPQLKGDRPAPGHQHQDRRAPPREHPREARHARSRRTNPLRDPARTRRSVEAIEFTDRWVFAPGLRSIRCRVVLDALARAPATYERCRGPQASRTTRRNYERDPRRKSHQFLDGLPRLGRHRLDLQSEPSDSQAHRSLSGYRATGNGVFAPSFAQNQRSDRTLVAAETTSLPPASVLCKK